MITSGMKAFHEHGNISIYCAECLEALRENPANLADAGQRRCVQQ